MKLAILSAATVVLSLGAAQAQTLNKTPDASRQNAPGTTGALGNVSANGVATDPEGVKQQQGGSTNAPAGTVGAAPGTTPAPSSK